MTMLWKIHLQNLQRKDIQSISPFKKKLKTENKTISNSKQIAYTGCKDIIFEYIPKTN